MSNAASETSTETEAEIIALAPGELASKILQLRAKGDAKNHPKKPKVPSVPRVIVPSAEGEKAPSSPSKTAEKRDAAALLVNAKLENLTTRVEKLTQLMATAQEQNLVRDKAFDLLYEEMSGYKNDFFYERLKPTLRALLFLLDSIEEFEREVEEHEKNGVATPNDIVQANLTHFRDQLTDVFALSEMAPIETEDNQFDAKTQRAVQVVKVEDAQNNTVQRQIRSGWTLGGKMLRPADVVIGRSE